MTTKPVKSSSKTTPVRATKSTRPRKMKTYHPRRSSKSLKLTKQELVDLERRISGDIGTFLVLLEQGNTEQIMHASQKARSDFLKLAPDMRKLAVEMGGVFPAHVAEFLDSIDNILHTGVNWMDLHTGINWIDEGKMKDCYNATKKLEEALKKRLPKGTL